jgi:renalase
VTTDVLIVGAGVSGLSCAKVLVAAGKKVCLLERSRGVGGRCATRRVEGQSVDHGLVFFHGRDPDFLEALRDVPGHWLERWPTAVLGAGTPCQPNAFVHGARRMAHADGMSAFPKHLAAGLDVALETEVKGIELVDDGIRVLATRCSEPAAFVGRNIVLALAGPQALSLLECPILSASGATARALLAMMPSVPCATVIALYPLDIGLPSWDIWYPEASAVLTLISHDSAKREHPSNIALVLQARPVWSSQVTSTDESQWAPQLLREAASVIGPWVARPKTWQAHLWRHARTSPECELSCPLLVDLGGGRHVGIAGELFAPGRGVHAAWQSGRRLALRLLEEVHE